METKLERIAERAESDPQCRFTSLAHLLSEENLKVVYRELKKELNGYIELIRSGDDFLLCFQRKAEAEAGYRMLTKRLAKFGLKLSQEKTKLIASADMLNKTPRDMARNRRLLNF